MIVTASPNHKGATAAVMEKQESFRTTSGGGDVPARSTAGGAGGSSAAGGEKSQPSPRLEPFSSSECKVQHQHVPISKEEGVVSKETTDDEDTTAMNVSGSLADDDQDDDEETSAETTENFSLRASSISSAGSDKQAVLPAANVVAGASSVVAETSTANEKATLLRLQKQQKQRIIYDAAQSVLMMIRKDARYVNPARFTEELTVTEVYGHSLHMAFQELLPKLSSSSSGASSSAAADKDGMEDASFFLDPFCEAITQKDNSPAVAAAVLQILAKFLDCGLVDDTRGFQKIASAVIRCPWTEEKPMSDPSSSGTSHRRQSSISMAHPTIQHASSMDSAVEPTSALGRRRSSIMRPLGGGGNADMLGADHANNEVVLNVFYLAVRTVQTAFSMLSEDSCPLLSGKYLMEVLESCWRVASSTTHSSLLQSSAQTTCQQIAATIVGGSASNLHLRETRYLVLQWLSDILQVEDDQSGNHDHKMSLPAPANGTVASKRVEPTVALTLLSTTLDRIVDVTDDGERLLLESIAKHVLFLAIPTASDQILQTSFRVFFQLIDRLQLRYLKCEIELLLQNAHLRRLDELSTPEETEAVLESLLELCYGGGTLHLRDLYLNYDCDVACTNLFEAVMTALGKMACPDGWSSTTSKSKEDAVEAGMEDADNLTVATTATATESSEGNKTSAPSSSGVGSSSETANTKTATSGNKPLPEVSTHAPLNHLNRLALEGILSVLDTIAHRCNGNYDPSVEDNAGGVDAVTEEELCLRKKKKNAMVNVVQSFNSENSDKEEFLRIAVAEGLLESTLDGAKVAELLYHAPEDLDKKRLGVYLSRGPEEKFPFHASVRSHFASFYDFTGLTFATALRKFLSKFYLPGEAQCIDRLMEAFSKEVYRQQSGDDSCVFKNADAVYVLAFSTIMLNTDLHNPTIKANRRMTEDQFLKNNRGLNGGEDLPDDFLSELYDHIKHRQLQVRRDAGDFMKKQKQDHSNAWDGILDRKREIAPPVSVESSEKRYVGLQDKEMFLILVKSSLHAVSGVFARSYDDALVVRTLRGLQQMVKLAACFEFDSIINDVLQILLPQGRDYVSECITFDQQQHSNAMDMEASVETPGLGRALSTGSLFDDETTIGADNDQHIPFGLLCSSDERGQVDISGSAANRGLLALDSSFVLLRKYSKGVTDAWPAFFACLCAMRDCHSLPAGLSDLDDFADSNGNVLPLSSFAKASKKRLDDYHRSLWDSNSNQQKGWFRSFFRKGQSGEQHESTEDISDDWNTSPKGMYSKTLLGVAKAADIENIVQMGSSQLPDAMVRNLLDKLDAFPFTNDPVGEQHAVFSLELAARTLLLNRERAVDLFLLFLSKFESILCRATISGDDVASPFAVERIVVTILRSGIHLYKHAELRPHLRASLQLLTMTLPRSFIRAISDRMACGLAIILRASFHFFDNKEWSFMGDTLDTLANHSSSRVFVFDGIASTVEYSLPNSEADSQHDPSEEGSIDGERPKLSKEACISLSRILTRFVLGFYQNDTTLTVPAMLCLEKVYNHKVQLLLQEQEIQLSGIDPRSMVPDQDFWQNVAVALYSACRSPDPETSSEGLECYRRIILRTSVDQIPEEKWIAIMYLMVNKQPPMSSEVSRGNTFSILSHLLVRTLPQISHSENNREDLEDLVIQYASLAEENLRQSRRGILFEKTLQCLTYISNHVVSNDWNGENEFSVWASETLLKELERIGKGAKVVTTAQESEDVSEISDSVAESDVEEVTGAR